jgi:hypothetical protein
VVAVAGLSRTVWSTVQNAYFYFFYFLLLLPCPSLFQRVSWNIPGLFIGGAMLLFGLWTYRKGKEGVPLVSVR